MLFFKKKLSVICAFSVSVVYRSVDRALLASEIVKTEWATQETSLSQSFPLIMLLEEILL